MSQSGKFVYALIAASGLSVAALTSFGSADASDFKILYAFCTQQNCADGANPYSGLIQEKQGNLYGTTTNGGQAAGTVFKLDSSGIETVLYNFCGYDCKQGSLPGGGLLDVNGQIYGTTEGGGRSDCDTPDGCGTIFKLAKSGAERVPHRFTGYPDGAVPFGSLIADNQGNLYGTTVAGGFDNALYGSCPAYYGTIGCGTVFKLVPNRDESVLYTFCSPTGCPDGSAPYAGLIIDTSNNLYGTTSGGGSGGEGTVFRIAPSGTETVLYNFCSLQNCVDGADPVASLITDSSGNLYGTTAKGGNTSGTGTVFKLAPDGTETVLYSFCAETNCSDGAVPRANLVMDDNGDLFGTTESGGDTNCECGTVFEIAPDGTETVLHAFRGGANGNGGDGAYPYAGLITDKRGDFFGTTAFGGVVGSGNHCGNIGCGTVFRIKP